MSWGDRISFTSSVLAAAPIARNPNTVSSSICRVDRSAVCAVVATVSMKNSGTTSPRLMISPMAQLDVDPGPDTLHRMIGIRLLGFEQTFRSEEHTSELQSLMRISYAVFCLKKTTNHIQKKIYK